MAFAMLCLFAYGCLMLFIRFWFGVLTHHQHKVKTSHGISDGSYSYMEASPIHGPGQGATGGPGRCVISTSILLHTMDRLAHGVQFCDPAQHCLYVNRAAMFIDDNTSATNKFTRWLHTMPSPDVVVEGLRHDAQVWPP
jgi:hypothetical protein